jgi:DNA-binding response OmpR family regulator
MIRNPEGPKYPFLPIIILTAYSEKKQVIMARDAGATEFLCKPVSATALYRRIQNVIENPRPFIRTRDFFGPDRRRYANPNYSGEERRVSDNKAYIVDLNAFS